MTASIMAHRVTNVRVIESVMHDNAMLWFFADGVEITLFMTPAQARAIAAAWQASQPTEKTEAA